VLVGAQKPEPGSRALVGLVEGVEEVEGGLLQAARETNYSCGRGMAEGVAQESVSGCVPGIWIWLEQWGARHL